MIDWLELIKLLLVITLGVLFFMGLIALCIVFWIFVGVLIVHTLGYLVYWLARGLWRRLRPPGKRIREANSSGLPAN